MICNYVKMSKQYSVDSTKSCIVITLLCFTMALIMQTVYVYAALTIPPTWSDLKSPPLPPHPPPNPPPPSFPPYPSPSPQPPQPPSFPTVIFSPPPPLPPPPPYMPYSIPPPLSPPPPSAPAIKCEEIFDNVQYKIVYEPTRVMACLDSFSPSFPIRPCKWVKLFSTDIKFQLFTVKILTLPECFEKAFPNKIIRYPYGSQQINAFYQVFNEQVYFLTFDGNQYDSVKFVSNESSTEVLKYPQKWCNRNNTFATAPYFSTTDCRITMPSFNYRCITTFGDVNNKVTQWKNVTEFCDTKKGKVDFSHAGTVIAIQTTTG